MKKMSEKIKLIFILALLIFSASFIIAQEVSYCCEKTTSGAYCQNVPSQDQCNVGVKNPETGERFGVSPSACSSTSYCQVGCCYDSDEGICMENTPREACRVANGFWSEQGDCNIAQCDLGCCVVGTEAAYVTLARCKKLAGSYGIGLNFRDDINDELSCIALATSQDLGACVYEKDFSNTCIFGTREQCNSASLGSGVNGTTITFYKDYLCSAENFNTDCGRSKETRCEDGKVYFVDTCGNRANIYDSSKVNSVEYWTKLSPASESCQGNPRTCGNCEYLGAGTICGEATRSEGVALGNYICKDVNCYDTSNGKDYRNGESWCVYDNDNPGEDSVGSRHFRHICFMGEEIVEPCGDLRQEVCFESSIGEEEDFSQAGCGVNRWQDCILQDNVPDCLNTDKRDCIWVPIDEELNIIGAAIGIGIQEREIDRTVARNIARLSQLIPPSVVYTDENDLSKCVPRYSPGLKFWDEGNSLDTCAVVDAECVVKYEKGLLGGEWTPVENEFCLEAQSEATMALLCSKLADCGPGFNYVGKFVNRGYEISISDKGEDEVEKDKKPAEPTKDNGQTFGGSSGGEFSTSKPASPTSGNVVQGLIVKSFNRFVKE
jgi:hypothetical protein